MGLGNYRVHEEKPRRGLWPVYGLMMAVSMGAIAYVLAPQLLRYVRNRSPQFSIGTLTDQEVTLLYGIIIFLVLITIGTLLLAIFVPRRRGADAITDKVMVKQKKLAEAEERARKKRQLELARKNREQSKRLE